MLALIIGQSGSGKSAFAEDLVINLGEYKRVYVATMEILDDECKKRIDRHRKMRATKNFQTIESPTHLENVSVGCDSVVLLECMSNLVANEIYSPDGRPENVVDIICEGVNKLNSQSKALVVVTNDVFADAHKYDEGTEEYMRKLGEINCRIGNMADEVYEVVLGVAKRLK